MIEPLIPYLQFKKIGWDGSTIPNFQVSKNSDNPVVFFQIPPREEIIFNKDLRIIWIPMWDQARAFDLKWWNQLPKNIRIISFSNEISLRSRAAGLDTFDVRFFMNPDDFVRADFDKPRTLFYWNRAGLVGIKFLKRLCKTLDIDQLLFRRRLDPGRKEIYDYEIPDILGNTVVKKLTFNFEGVEGHNEYLNYLNQANIFIAPRMVEGVGLTLIEAMARGCSVFAFNAPTMNEYICHKSNGYLLDRCNPQFLNCLKAKMEKTIIRVNRKIDIFGYQHDFPVTAWQDWSEIKGLDLKSLGASALRDQKIGYKEWKDNLPKYASFISDWK